MCSALDNVVHKWEQAGLGKAPFRFIGMEEKVFVVPGVMSKPRGRSLGAR